MLIKCIVIHTRSHWVWLEVRLASCDRDPLGCDVDVVHNSSRDESGGSQSNDGGASACR